MCSMPSVAAASVPKTELSAVLDLCETAGSTADLAEGFGRVMRVLSGYRGFQRACLLLLDESTGKLVPVSTFGLTSNESDRGSYLAGEGITGGVAATGRARIIPDVRQEPDFLNRTGPAVAGDGRPELALRAAAARGQRARRHLGRQALQWRGRAPH